MISMQLNTLLKNIENDKKENRDYVANIVSKDRNLQKSLVAKVFDVDDKLSIKAAWILEWITTHYDLNLLLPHLDVFCNQLSILHFDSAIRPCSKICEQLAMAYYSKVPNRVKQALLPPHIESMVTAGFDWLITPQKIAVKAYTMTALYLFGTEQDWIHPELEHLIRTKIMHEGKGCKARGNKVLDLIEKHKKRNI